MKLHEIDWTDGKEYLMVTTTGNKFEVVVKDRELAIQGSPMRIDNILNLLAIVESEFTEVIKPVTFLEAYQDCLGNKVKYKSLVNVDSIGATLRGFGDGDVLLEIDNNGSGCYSLNYKLWEKVEG